jgi:predicted MFS family arabinose efflux permease
MSAQAFLPSIVPRELLEKANGRLYSIEMICNSFLGLPLGAWLFVLAIGVPFGVNAASFAMAAALVASIRMPVVDGATDSGAAGVVAGAPAKSFRKDLREGMQWLWANELVRTLAIMLGIANMAGMFGSAIFVKYAADELGVTGRGFGLLLSVMAVGSIVGGLIGHRIVKRLGVAWAIILAYAIFGLGGIVYVVLPRVWAIVIAVAVFGVASTTWNIVTVSLRQRIIPTELFGRVNSVYRFVGTGSMAIGALVGGFIAYRYGLRAPYLASVIIGLAGLAWGGPILLRQLKLQDHAS